MKSVWALGASISTKEEVTAMDPNLFHIDMERLGTVLMKLRFWLIVTALLVAPIAAHEIPGNSRESGSPGTASPVAQSTHCLVECPSGAPLTNDLITRQIYTLSNNGNTKFADWVAYTVTAATIGRTQTRNWKADPLLPSSKTLEPEDYAGANATLHTDRGHQAPLASFTGTPFGSDTNFLSNITPQKADLNQGPWERLESAERRLAQQPAREALFGLTGPLYERTMPQLPRADEPHRIPSGYWKIVSVQQGDTIEVAAFIMDQDTPRGDHFCDHLTTVDEVEQRSGLDFFAALDDSLENEMEQAQGALAARLGCGQ